MVATPLLQLLRPKLWSHHWLLSFTHHIQSFSKYCHFSLQNMSKIQPLPSTSTVITLVQILNVSFPDFLNSSPAPGPLSSLLKSAREFPSKWSQFITNMCPKPSSDFPFHSEKARVLLWPTGSYMVWPRSLSDSFPAALPMLISSVMNTSQTHSHLRAFVYTVSTTRKALPPDISKAHSLTSFSSSLRCDILIAAFPIIPI